MPYKIFQPIPLGPRLQAMYANPDMAKAMRYCANYHEELEDKQSERTEELGPENKPDQQQENIENIILIRNPMMHTHHLLHVQTSLQVASSRTFLMVSTIVISVKNRSKFHLKMKRVSKPCSTFTLKMSEMSHWGSHLMVSPFMKCLESQHRKPNTTHGHLISSTTTSIQPSEPTAGMLFHLE